MSMRMAGGLLAALGGGAAALGGKALYDSIQPGQAPPSAGDNAAGMRALIEGVIDGELTAEAAAEAVGSGVSAKDIVRLAQRVLAEQVAPAAPPQASVVPL
jgi:hypothetical protein